LRTAGYINKGQSWYLDGVDSIVVFNLQKSDFAEKYYVNIGVWLKQLGDESFPASHRCHISTRLDSLFKDRIELIDRACRVDAENPYLEAFLELVRDEFLPFAAACGSMSWLRRAYREQVFASTLIFKEARALLIGDEQS
jgi:hypothetical protein